MQRDDRNDPQGSRRLTVAFVLSLFLHALLALFLFSTAVPTSEATSPESIPGWQQIVTVSRQGRAKPSTPSATRPVPITPHAPVALRPQQAQPLSAPPHPRVVHELSKFAPTAPPNPTPAPEASAAPNPLPTQPQIAVTAAPLPLAAPTSVPTAAIAAVAIRVPPTAAPSPKPSAAPTEQPTAKPAPPTSAPTAPPRVNPAVPSAGPSLAPRPAPPRPSAAPLATPGIPSPGPSSAARAVAQHAGPSPGPKPAASPGAGKSTVARVAPAARPVQVPTTPQPAPVVRHVAAPHPQRTSKPSSLNERLRKLIPTSAPATPEPPKRYSNIGNIQPGARQEPTPPPEVLAATKYLYVENVAGTPRWKLWPLGTTPEELSVKMYVTSVKHLGFATFCHGWLLRYPLPPAHGTYNLGSNFDVGPKPEIEANVTYLCNAHSLQPFTPPSPSPAP